MAERILTKGDPNMPTIIIQQRGRRWLVIILLLALGFSVLMNLGFMASFAEFAVDADQPTEKFHSGTRLADSKIARIQVGFTIMPPYTERIKKTIDHVREDDSVKGVLLVIDSPGGLVSDSHEIYHKLKLLAEKKPIYVQMKGIAASGGYYIAMGGGPEAPIYAEPTTWTGSIGVIIPRYNATELAEKVGVKSESLVTGPFKDSLNPFKDLDDQERAVWDAIIEDSFNRFLTVIDENRSNLDMEAIRELATGQVYTADQAVENGLVDEISFESDTIDLLAEKLGLSSYQVVNYSHPMSLSETLLGATTSLPKVEFDPVSSLIDLATPRAFYLFGLPHEMNVSRPQLKP
ncbi:signal peptide peptidase SppA [Thalassoglobus sp. JC818]|uniref:signal peptide peptidase SppA n=1 Tax=Thalassoglobus sp. JC818 TaxID=3232136 RepID=UPI003458CD8E